MRKQEKARLKEENAKKKPLQEKPAKPVLRENAAGKNTALPQLPKKKEKKEKKQLEDAAGRPVIVVATRASRFLPARGVMRMCMDAQH